MPSVKIDSRQVISRSALSQLANTPNSELDDILLSINAEVAIPLSLSESSTPDRILNIGPISVANPTNNKNKTIPPIDGSIPDFISGTVELPSITGGAVTVTPGTNTTLTLSNNSFIKMGIFINSSGQLSVVFGAEGATAALAPLPAALADTFFIGYVLIESDGGGSVSTVTNDRIFQFVGGGGGGSGSGGLAIQYTNTNGVIADETHHLVDSSVAPLALTLPSGTAESKIRLSDALRTFGTNNVVLTPSAGQQIDGAGVGSTLTLNITRGYVELTYNTTESNWVADYPVIVSGGSVPLEIEYINSNIVAQDRKLYHGDSSGGAFSIQLPAGSEGFVLEVRDILSTFGTNNVTIIPNTGERISDFAIDETLVLNIDKSWIQLSWDVTQNRWVLKAPGVISGDPDNVLNVVADYTVTDIDGVSTVLVTTGATTRSVTLPAAATNAGRSVEVKKIDAGIGKVNIIGTIDGTANRELRLKDDFITVRSDGINWFIVGKRISPRSTLKILGSSISVSGQINELTCNNLEIGKWYHAEGDVTMSTNVGAPSFLTILRHESGLGSIYQTTALRHNSSTTTAITVGFSFKFQADNSTLISVGDDVQASGQIIGNGTRNSGSWIRLTEIDPIIQDNTFV